LGSHRGIEEMKSHKWFRGFEWDKLASQSTKVQKTKPHLSFDKGYLDSDQIRKCVREHINSKSIPTSDQYQFQRYVRYQLMAT
jgi:hypothetical protein